MLETKYYFFFLFLVLRPSSIRQADGDNVQILLPIPFLLVVYFVHVLLSSSW